MIIIISLSCFVSIFLKNNIFAKFASLMSVIDFRCILLLQTAVQIFMFDILFSGLYSYATCESIW